MLNSALCDELDKSALSLLYDKWKGIPINSAQFKQGTANLVSYGIYLTPDVVFGQPVKAVPVRAHSDAEIEAAFQSLQGLGAGDDVRTAAGGVFITIILPLLLKILAGFLV